jgi:hypothetical protein
MQVDLAGNAAMRVSIEIYTLRSDPAVPAKEIRGFDDALRIYCAPWIPLSRLFFVTQCVVST